MALHSCKHSKIHPQHRHGTAAASLPGGPQAPHAHLLCHRLQLFTTQQPFPATNTYFHLHLNTSEHNCIPSAFPAPPSAKSLEQGQPQRPPPSGPAAGFWQSQTHKKLRVDNNSVRIPLSRSIFQSADQEAHSYSKRVPHHFNALIKSVFQA